MPKFNVGDEVLVPATVVWNTWQGEPVVAFKRSSDRLAYGNERLVVPDAIPAPKPPRMYEFQFSVTVTRSVVVRAISESAARQRVGERDDNTRIVLEDVLTLEGESVSEWPR